jgi:hypothetical protein
MKKKMQRHVQAAEIPRSRDDLVHAEIKTFFDAIDSYPARAARNPHLSFTRHLSSFLDEESDKRRLSSSHRSDRSS